MGKRIEFDDAARGALRRGVEQLAGAVRVTLGPRGRNVVIDHGGGLPTITNDGVTIAREIELADPFENMGVKLAREVALKTGEIAGDGTTTATVLAHSIVSRGLQAVAAGHNPVAVKRGIERAVEAVVEELARRSRPVSGRADVARVATISAGDEGIGAQVAEAMDRVGRHGVITVEEGRGMETTLDLVEGVRFERGYLSPYFITRAETMEAVLENPLILLSDLKLSSVNELLPVLEHAARAGRGALIVADDVEAEPLATLVVNRLRGTVASVAVRAPEFGDRRRGLLEDLAVLTGARLFASDLGRTLERFAPADFGRARRVVVERDHTTVIEGGGRPEEIRERIAALTRALAESDAGSEREWLRERLGRLTGGVVVIRVGAATEVEMTERRARVEDALAATRAAVEEGVVTGGGVALLRARRALEQLELKGDEWVGRDIVSAALEEPLRWIAANAGEDGPLAVERVLRGEGAFGFDAMAGAYRDLDDAGIMDPAKVVRCALQNAASIGAMVLTTDAIVVESKPDEPGSESEPPGA